MNRKTDPKKKMFAIVGIIILFALLIIITTTTSVSTYRSLNEAMEEMSIDTEE